MLLLQYPGCQRFGGVVVPHRNGLCKMIGPASRVSDEMTCSRDLSSVGIACAVLEPGKRGKGWVKLMSVSKALIHWCESRHIASKAN